MSTGVRQRTFNEEIAIAEGNRPALKNPVEGYVFNNGKRKFQDKVEKNGKYD